jgi:hypothetical protein
MREEWHAECNTRITGTRGGWSGRGESPGASRGSHRNALGRDDHSSSMDGAHHTGEGQRAGVTLRGARAGAGAGAGGGSLTLGGSGAHPRPRLAAAERQFVGLYPGLTVKGHCISIGMLFGCRARGRDSASEFGAVVRLTSLVGARMLPIKRLGPLLGLSLWASSGRAVSRRASWPLQRRTQPCMWPAGQVLGLSMGSSAVCWAVWPQQAPSAPQRVPLSPAAPN